MSADDDKARNSERRLGADAIYLEEAIVGLLHGEYPTTDLLQLREFPAARVTIMGAKGEMPSIKHFRLDGQVVREKTTVEMEYVITIKVWL